VLARRSRRGPTLFQSPGPHAASARLEQELSRWSLPRRVPEYPLVLTLEDARRQIETWRLDYNHVRPHSSLGDVPPSEFAEAGLRRAKPASTPLPPPTQKAENQG